MDSRCYKAGYIPGENRGVGMDKAGDCRKNNSKKENQWRKNRTLIEYW